MPNATINFNTSGQHQVIAAPSGTGFIRVLGYERIAGGTVNVKFQNGNTDLEGPLPLVAQAGDVVSDRDGVFDCTPGNALNINLDANVQVSGHVKYAVFGA